MEYKESLVGKTYFNNDGLELVILEYQGQNKRNQYIYKIEFIKSGYIKENLTISNINKGSVKDRLTPVVCGVGCLGEATKSDNLKEYNLWMNMLKRCYDKTAPAYKWYGEKGVTVCARWFRFDYFLEDLPYINGWNKILFNENKIKLDKDIFNGSDNFNDKEYSLENCIFVSHLLNMKEATKRYNTTKSIKHVIYPNGKDEIVTNLTDFCKKHDLNYRNVYHALEKKSSNIKGYKFYYEKCND
jgi:hypothetical protein